MTDRILLITHYNQYETKRLFTAYLAEALNQCGAKALVLDWGKNRADFKRLIKEFEPDLMLSFNSAERTASGEYLWDILKIPLLFVVVDPVIYYANVSPSPYSILACVDRNDVQTLAENGYSRMFFLPHATAAYPVTDKERPYDVVLTGSCYDYESLKEDWTAHFPTQIHPVIEASVELVLGPGCISIAQAISETWHLAHLPPEGVDFRQLYYYIDYYSRGLDRVNLVKAMRNVNVHVFGEFGQGHPSAKKGWDYYLKDLPNVTLHGPLNFNEALSVQQQAKICLNSMPFFKNGSHERILTSLAAGAVPLTSDSIWTHEEFVDNQDLLIYTPGSYADLGERVNALLENEPLRAEIAQRGREKVMSRHTWLNRAQEILRRMHE